MERILKRTPSVFVLCIATVIILPAQNFSTLHSFNGTDGASPNAVLLQATDGDLYGTTYNGGYFSNFGTIFKITPSGTLTTLHSFCASQAACMHGHHPMGGVVQAADGSFYGTTSMGGPNNGGTIFKLTPNGTLITLYTFCSQAGCADGMNPGGLVLATNGNFYGTTYMGGTQGHGTVFKITPAGMLTTLYSFCSQNGCTDGSDPFAVRLIQATNGDFYGVTSLGGTSGGGTIFKITPAGTLTTLYSFCSQTGCADGSSPQGVLQATNGDFYGTTYNGGAYGNYGTIFKVTTVGAFTSLHSFCSQNGCPDGWSPQALMQATNGDFFGTTFNGGAYGPGTIFKITPDSTLTTLYSFCSQNGCPDGAGPNAGLVQATNGEFYGTTQNDGAGFGTIFRLSVRLGPFVETQPTSGEVGTAIKILGTDLSGTSKVSFNGTPAAFKVVSRSEISTSVPAGATSGKVQVVIPIATLSSNVPFRVLP